MLLYCTLLFSADSGCDIVTKEEKEDSVAEERVLALENELASLKVGESACIRERTRQPQGTVTLFRVFSLEFELKKFNPEPLDYL